jgi:hypothetical protein
MFHQRPFGRAHPRGNDLFSVERWPRKAQRVPILAMTSSSFMVILGGRLGISGTCGMLERPLWDQHFAHGCLICPKRG